MRVSRRDTTLPSYHLNNTNLEPVSCYKYLGVLITSDLSCKMHVTHVTNNANRTLGFIRRNFNFSSLPVKLLLYKSLVRSKMEYAASVWDPSQETLIHQLESIQSRAARFILSNYHRTSSVTSMKTTLSLPLLSQRREISRLCLFHKIYYHNSVLKNKLITPSSYVSARVDHRHKVGIPTCHTNHFYNSFIPRTSASWNHLPRSVVEMSNTSMFKAAITNLSP